MSVRLRQAVLAALDLEQTIETLRMEFGLGEPYRDPGVAYFGLANAVLAIGDTFLEVVSPFDAEQPGARTAVRQLERGGRETCGYTWSCCRSMICPPRARGHAPPGSGRYSRSSGATSRRSTCTRDMRGAIVSLSAPRPAGSWRWGGAEWTERAVPGRVAGATIAVADPDTVAGRWATIAGGPPNGCTFVPDERSKGLIEIEPELGGIVRTLRIAS